MKSRLESQFKWIRKLLGSARFAIPLLGVFALAMMVGTVIESRFGASVATLTVYMTWWFFLIQGLMLLSLIVAVLDRLPMQKRLYGFYLIHAGIVILIVGSVLTRYLGIDGTIQIEKGLEKSEVSLQEDQLILETTEEKLSLTLEPRVLTWTGLKTLAKTGLFKIDLIRYIPFAKAETIFVPKKGSTHVDLVVRNEQLAEKISLLNPGNLISPNSKKMGPLEIKMISWDEFERTRESAHQAARIIVQGESQSIELTKLPLNITLSGGEQLKARQVRLEKASLSFIEVQIGSRVYKFFPRYSEYPLKDHLEVDRSSPVRIVGKDSYINQGPWLHLAVDPNGQMHVRFIEKGALKTLAYPDGGILLPWMNLRLALTKVRKDETPELVFSEGAIHKESDKNIKAAQIQVTHFESATSTKFWISDLTATEQRVGPLSLAAMIGKKSVKLPFSVQLEKFQMEHNPGTMDAASYESDVLVHDSASKEVHSHKIFMNHPLKKAGFTLYQSSYFQDSDNEYVSVLSVNRDPGRWIKYFGAFVLVIGLIWHYLIVYTKISGIKK